jgi:hypothetical protein
MHTARQGWSVGSVAAMPAPVRVPLAYRATRQTAPLTPTAAGTSLCAGASIARWHSSAAAERANYPLFLTEWGTGCAGTRADPKRVNNPRLGKPSEGMAS